MNSLYGFKLDQTQAFDKDGFRVPLTRVQMDPNIVISWKSTTVLVGIGKAKHLNKPQQGLLKNLTEKKFPKHIREIKLEENEITNTSAETSQKMEKIQAAEVFNLGDIIKVSGISKGKGFAGVVKRHGFKGGPKTHGQSDRQRHGGSIGQTTTPGRVYKGKRMAGHMGVNNVTVKNLEVFGIDLEKNILLVRGLVPGGSGGLLKVTKIAGK